MENCHVCVQYVVKMFEVPPHYVNTKQNQYNQIHWWPFIHFRVEQSARKQNADTKKRASHSYGLHKA